MRTLAILCLLTSGVFTSGQQAISSRLGLPLQKRLDTPLTVASASVPLTDFVGFIATSFKVPLLVETTSPVPDVTIPAGSFSAQQLLDLAVRQLPGYKWEAKDGVAHLFQPDLASASGNLLNVEMERYYFPNNVADFGYQFRNCIHSTILGYGCLGGVMTGVVPPGLASEPLPYLEAFRNVTARTILLRALSANGHFYVLIAYESTHPRRTSDFPFLNWFTQSLVADDPAPMRAQSPAWLK